MSFPNRFRFLLLFSLLALVTRAPAGTPGAERLDLEHSIPATITVTPVGERWRGDGFMPVRVRIENRGSKPLAWEFSFEVSLGYSGTSLTHEVMLGAEAGSVFETVVFLPGAGVDSSNPFAFVTASLAGPGSRGYGGSFLHGGNVDVILTATTSALEAQVFSASHRASGHKGEGVTAVEPSLWPADWRVWSSFDRVALDDREFAALDGARRAALRDWVAMGGRLDIYPTDGFDGPIEVARSHGLGVIRRMTRSLADEATAVNKQDLTVGKSGVASLAETTSRTISSARRDALSPKSGALGVSLFLVVFGVMVGPVNLFVFAPSRRRHRLFITTPLISLGASLALGAYIVAKDGFGGEGSRQAFVWLVPDSNQAVVTQGQISRTGVLLGGGFELPDDVVITRTDRAPGGYYDHRSKQDSYSRAAGRTEGDWFTSRRVQEHLLQRLVPTRARVELVEESSGGKAPVVQSSVGTILRDFVYLDAHGTLWVANEIAPGHRVTLRKPTEPFVASAPRGCFTARGGEAEGLDAISTLTSIRWDETKFTYAGPVVGARTP